MTCEHDWTIRFPSVGFEVRPISMNLKLSRDKYDYCRAKLPAEVGREMKPHTRYDDGKLNDLMEAEVCYNGDVVKPLFFRPDFVDYGTTSTHLELHDLHKSLFDGIVDIQRQYIRLENIYPRVLNKTNHRLVDTVNFTLPESQTRVIYGKKNNDIVPGKAGRRDSVINPKRDGKEVSKVANSKNAVDFNKISPEKAIAILNKKFNITSWVNRKHELVVGLPEANGIQHVAAPNDNRVWRYKDPQISHGREPIKKVVVKGKWEDEKGIDLDVAGWFDKGGTNEAIAYGYAERKDIDYGTTVDINNGNAGKDSVAEVARLALMAKMREQNAGSVDLDPTLSGTQVSNVIDLHPGDLIRLVPDDDYFDKPTAESGVIGDPPTNDDFCSTSGFVNNEAYVTTEVEHNISEEGDWNVNTQLGMYSDIPIESWMSYYDPKEDETVGKKDMEEGWIENDLSDLRIVDYDY